MDDMTVNRKKFIEFFAPCNDPLLSTKEQLELLTKLQKEFDAKTHSSEYFSIAVMGQHTGKTTKERLDALDTYLRIRGDVGDSPHIVELRKMIQESDDK